MELRHFEIAGGVGLALLIAACGAEDSGGAAREWAGTWGTRVVESSTDCSGAEAPPTLPGFILHLEPSSGDSSGDSVTVTMNPIVRLAGRFDGDLLEAWMRVEGPIDLPESIARRAVPGDSLETITYALDLDFAGSGFEGEYVIRSPDLRALVLDGEGNRCEIRYRLSGRRMESAREEPAGSS